VAEEWVVIDFETASVRGTPCEVGAVKYRDGAEVDAMESLIFQPPQSFAPFNILLHGITPEAVAHAPCWPEARARLLDFAGGAPLVAHYAPFDVGVIRDASDLCELDWPTFDYTCTVTISRRVWPGLRSYSLLLLCSALGIPFNEWSAHDALADARLAGAVLREALFASSTDSLAELLVNIYIAFGRLAPDGWHGSYARSRALAGLEPNPEADPASPFYGKRVAFTGELAMVRREAGALIAASGGTPQDRPTKETDFLVCGYQDMLKLAQGETKSHKLRYAEELHAAGQPIEILTERDFFRMLSEVELTSRPIQPVRTRQRPYLEAPRV
jgi:DNA polymerase-3 subunit epsilon